MQWQPTLVFLPGESHGQKSLAGYSPWGHKQADMTEQLTRAVTAGATGNTNCACEGIQPATEWKRSGPGAHVQEPPPPGTQSQEAWRAACGPGRRLSPPPLGPATAPRCHLRKPMRVLYKAYHALVVICLLSTLFLQSQD